MATIKEVISEICAIGNKLEESAGGNINAEFDPVMFAEEIEILQQIVEGTY